MPHVVFLLICAIWGSNFILMKKAGLVFGPLGIGAWRVVGGAAVLSGIWWLGRDKWWLTRREVRHIVPVALVTYAWPFAVQPFLIVRYGSAFIGMMVAFVPLLTILASVPMLGVRPTPRQLGGVVGGLACIGLILLDGLDRAVPPSGLALAVTVPLCYAVGNTYIKRNLSGAAPLPLTAVALFAAGSLLLPLSLARPLLERGGLGPPPPCGPQEWWYAVAAVVVLGVLGTGLATYAFNGLLRAHGPLFAGMVTYLIPLGALGWGYIDGEPITSRQLLALGGVFAMVALVQFGAVGRPEPVDARR